jgi:hypothetical protein
VSFLIQEDVENLLPLAGPLAAGGLEIADVGQSRHDRLETAGLAAGA